MSDIFLDTQYIHNISYKLQRFHKTGKDKWSFRCPVCGDSTKDKSKTRGNFQIHKGQVYSGCYNCDTSLPFNVFLKRFFPDDYDEYLVESYGGTKKTYKEVSIESVKPKFKPSINNSSFYDTLVRIDLLPDNHPAKQYVINRGIKQLDRLYYTPKFKQFCNKVKPKTFENEKYDTPRLIIPFVDEQGNTFCFQGRSFDPNSKTKYITIKLDEEKSKIYGLDRIDKNKPKLLIEGPLNTLFLVNAVAATGSNLESYADELGDPIIVFDNDSRNKIIVDKVWKSVQAGRRVVLWSNRFKGEEDINDIAVNYNLSPQEITDYLIENSYSGLEAELQFTRWKKI